ncbi:MAG: Coenzyme F420 hydrogenase/dehydrogenase, beta subunit C-terminal domain [Gemmobacter sp.]
MSQKTPAPSSAALRLVARGDLCSGCGGCAAVAPDRIVMAEAAPGYLRPQQSAPLTPQQEEAITRICPGLVQEVAAQGREDHPLWGPYVGMRTGWACDPEVRFAGSSGGALSAILLHLLDTGRVDRVLLTGAAPDLPTGNAAVFVTDRAGVLAGAGSRYAPSAPLAALPEAVASGLRHAVVGKPCDIAALRALAAIDPAVAAAVPVMLSFFYAGVPSHSGGRAVLSALGAAEPEVAAFRFRGNGWPGRATATLTDGSERSMSYHDSWGGILSKHVQHRCRICADGTGTAADIVCADAWESDEAGYPLFDEADGTSLIVARTGLGAELIAGAEAAGAVATAPFDVAALAAIQPGQRGRRRALLARLIALRLCGRPVPRYRGLQLRAAARQNPLRRNLHNFLGTIRRVLFPRRRPGG